MQIKKNLNLVIPLDYEQGGQIFVHSTPISREVFEQYFLVLSKTFAEIYTQKLNFIAGPRIAYLMLRDIAKEMDAWDGQSGVQFGLINEIIRLSNVVMPDKGGWKTVPLATVISQKLIDEDTIAEIEGELVFFICASTMHKKSQQSTILEVATQLWGSRLTSLDCTAFKASCATSTEEGSTGEMGSIS